MRTSEQRIAAYKARMVSSLIDPALAAVSELQKANFAAYANKFCPKQEALRVILNDLGVPTTQFFGYEAFNGEMFHLSEVTAGDSAIATATILVAKYVTWTLTEEVLIQIAADIWSIIVPPA